MPLTHVLLATSRFPRSPVKHGCHRHGSRALPQGKRHLLHHHCSCWPVCRSRVPRSPAVWRPHGFQRNCIPRSLPNEPCLKTPDPCSFPRARALPRVRPGGNYLRRAVKIELEVLMPTVLRTAHGAQLWEVQCPCGNGNFAANPKTFPTPNKRMAAARAMAPSGKDQAKCVAACASKGAMGGDPNCEHRYCTTGFKLVKTVCDDLILPMLAAVHHDFRFCSCSHLRCNIFVANRAVHLRDSVTARLSPRASLRTRPKPPKASRGTSQILVHGSKIAGPWSSPK